MALKSSALPSAANIAPVGKSPVLAKPPEKKKEKKQEGRAKKYVL